MLSVIYNLTSNYGLSIILLTIIVKLLVFPMTVSAMKSSKKMQELQPKMQELQNKYKGNPEVLNQKLAEFYKENKFNPFGGCLPMFIQIPIVYGLFVVFKDPSVFGLEVVNQSFLWVSDLTKPDLFSNILNMSFADKIPGILPIISALLTYYQLDFSNKSMVKTNSKSQDPTMKSMESMNNSMKFIFPIMLLTTGMTVSSGIALYWSVSTFLAILQQMYINKLK